MRPGLYEARSVDHPERVACVVLEDVAGARITLHRMRRALEQIADKPRDRHVGAVARWALEDVEEG